MRIVTSLFKKQKRQVNFQYLRVINRCKVNVFFKVLRKKKELLIHN